MSYKSGTTLIIKNRAFKADLLKCVKVKLLFGNLLIINEDGERKK